MNQQRITLTDVMRGVKKHKLADKLSDGVYKFLVELILEANELGFKNPFDLTLNQALAIGGGDSRQTLYNRRKALRKILIDGKHLVKVTVGNYGRNALAWYNIDYELLCSYNGVWQRVTPLSSNEVDKGGTNVRHSLDTTIDDTLPILRSEEKRKDKTTSEDLTLATTQEATETDSEVVVLPSAVQESDFVLTTKSDVRIIEGAILSGYRIQIMDRPPAQNKIRAALEIYDVNQLCEAIDRMPDILKPKNPRTVIDGDYALDLACLTAKNPHLWRNGEDDDENGRTGISNAEELRQRKEFLALLLADEGNEKGHHGYDEAVEMARAQVAELEGDDV